LCCCPWPPGHRPPAELPVISFSLLFRLSGRVFHRRARFPCPFCFFLLPFYQVLGFVFPPLLFSSCNAPNLDLFPTGFQMDFDAAHFLPSFRAPPRAFTSNLCRKKSLLRVLFRSFPNRLMGPKLPASHFFFAPQRDVFKYFCRTPFLHCFDLGY